jgi:P27 family predicted phage terminase small subunit
MVRGRKPTPTTLKLLRGNPGKRALNLNEPQLKPELPEPPDFLQGGALDEWNRIAPPLHQAGLLTALDAEALAFGCQSYATFVEAVENIRISGTVIKSSKGQPMVSPYVKVANAAWQQWMKMLPEFGMTPSSRSRVKVPETKDPSEDAFEKWRSRRRR